MHILFVPNFLNFASTKIRRLKTFLKLETLVSKISLSWGCLKTPSLNKAKHTQIFVWGVKHCTTNSFSEKTRAWIMEKLADAICQFVPF